MYFGIFFNPFSRKISKSCVNGKFICIVAKKRNRFQGLLNLFLTFFKPKRVLSSFITSLSGFIRLYFSNAHKSSGFLIFLTSFTIDKSYKIC